MIEQIINLDGAFIFKNTSGTFTAGTYTKSKDFKTLKGASKWLWRNCSDSKKQSISEIIKNLYK
jgi:hypothetical protein